MTTNIIQFPIFNDDGVEAVPEYDTGPAFLLLASINTKISILEQVAIEDENQLRGFDILHLLSAVRFLFSGVMGLMHVPYAVAIRHDKKTKQTYSLRLWSMSVEGADKITNAEDAVNFLLHVEFFDNSDSDEIIPSSKEDMDNLCKSIVKKNNLPDFTHRTLLSRIKEITEINGGELLILEERDGLLARIPYAKKEVVIYYR